LGDGDAGCGGAGERGQGDAVPAAAEPGAERAERDRTPDTEAAVPDVGSPDRVAAGAEVQLGVGEHVVEPAAEDTERHRPDRHVDDVVGLAATGDPPSGSDDDSRDDAGQDHSA
jgi:hypothetical protein